MFFIFFCWTGCSNANVFWVAYYYHEFLGFNCTKLSSGFIFICTIYLLILFIGLLQFTNFCAVDNLVTVAILLNSINPIMVMIFYDCELISLLLYGYPNFHWTHAPFIMLIHILYNGYKYSYIIINMYYDNICSCIYPRILSE